MKYGDFFNGRSVIFFNIDQTIRQSKSRSKFLIHLADIELRMHARRRLCKLAHMGYTLVAISIQPDIDKTYSYSDALLKEGFFLTQRLLGKGKFHNFFYSSLCTKQKIDGNIVSAIQKNYQSTQSLYIAETALDLELAKYLKFETSNPEEFFWELDEI